MLGIDAKYPFETLARTIWFPKTRSRGGGPHEEGSSLTRTGVEEKQLNAINASRKPIKSDGREGITRIGRHAAFSFLISRVCPCVLPSLSGGGVRAGSIFAARRPFQRDKSLINAVDRLDVIKFPLARGFRLRNRSPTAGETSLGADPILLSSPLCFTDGYFRGGAHCASD